MDDGFFRSGLTLQTNAFSVLEVKLLISVLNSNFGMSSYIRFERNKPVIYIPANQISLLRSLVLEHMEQSTHYKLGLFQ